MFRFILMNSCMMVIGVGVYLTQMVPAYAGGLDNGNHDYPYDHPCESACEEPPAPVVPPVAIAPAVPEKDDNEDHRRYSALMTCCIRGAAGLSYGSSATCSAGSLQTAINRGEITPPGGGNCGLGSGGGSRQALASPFPAGQRAVNTAIQPLEMIFRSLFGF